MEEGEVFEFFDEAGDVEFWAVEVEAVEVDAGDSEPFVSGDFGAEEAHVSRFVYAEFVAFPGVGDALWIVSYSSSEFSDCADGLLEYR